MWVQPSSSLKVQKDCLEMDYEALEKAITPKTKAVIPVDYYIHVIMQEKIKLYLEYVKNASFWYDIKLIFKTFEVIVKE